jgi:D-sedoheptulose 7-phosphate isomerase
MQQIISRSIKKHKEALRLIEAKYKIINKIAKLIINSLENNGKIIFMGNGGSASDAQHLAAELVGRFKKNRKPLAAISLSANIATLTAVGNDFGFEEIFSRQIESLANKDDVVVGISTSGNSRNVINAITQAKRLKLKTVGFLGNNGGALGRLVDVALTVPICDTPRIQEMHIMAGHIICEIVEEHFV